PILPLSSPLFFSNHLPTPQRSTLSLHDALPIYSFTAGFPKTETYGLALQMRRAAVSVPANIAEGFRRRGKADKARYMNMAETETDRKSTRLNSSHVKISYAVFCLKKKKKKKKIK